MNGIIVAIAGIVRDNKFHGAINIKWRVFDDQEVKSEFKFEFVKIINDFYAVGQGVN